MCFARCTKLPSAVSINISTATLTTPWILYCFISLLKIQVCILLTLKGEKKEYFAGVIIPPVDFSLFHISKKSLCTSRTFTQREREKERKRGKQLYSDFTGFGVLTWVLGMRFFASKSQEQHL